MGTVEDGGGRTPPSLDRVHLPVPQDARTIAAGPPMGHRGTARDEPDEAVVRRVRSGDVDAYEVLIDRHVPLVRRIVGRNVPRAAVAEVAHEVFVSAYLSLSSYADSHPFERWLARIALRSCADFWRVRGRENRPGNPADLDVAFSERAMVDKDDRDLCEWALGKLEQQDREVLTLLYFEGLSVRECAQVLSWSESNVKVRAHRARLSLRRLLRQSMADEGPTR